MMISLNPKFHVKAELQKTADAINCLGAFCGKQNLSQLTLKSLQYQFKLKQVDALVLFGGSILAGGDIFAQGIKQNIAKKNIIVGGYGHTTDALIKQAIPYLSTVKKTGTKTETNSKMKLSEAEIFQTYIKQAYNVEADYLEIYSTNCGNNITNLLNLFKEKSLDVHSIILIQDATMSYRMEAILRRQTQKISTIINYPAYETKVIVKNQQLVFEMQPKGMWSINHYVSLLLGEIPRLTDNKNGYGPNGTNYLIHVDIPREVQIAFDYLKTQYPIRIANPDYATK